MKSRTRILAVLAVGACNSVDVGARGSFSRTDAFKQYIRTVVLTTSSAKNTKIWTVQRVRGNYTPLNPAGDLNGDLWPVIAETLTIPRTPWVAWSRRTVLDFDIAWSRWDAATAAWTTVASVVVGPSVGNDLDPDIAIQRGCASAPRVVERCGDRPCLLVGVPEHTLDGSFPRLGGGGGQRDAGRHDPRRRIVSMG